MAERPIPPAIEVLLGAVLYEPAWHHWMNATIGALGNRTPWEGIDAGEYDRVIALLESYADGSFG